MLVRLSEGGWGKRGWRSYLPVPLLLVSEGDDEIPEDHQADVGDHCGQSHHRFSDAVVLLRRTRCDPIGQGTIGR